MEVRTDKVTGIPTVWEAGKVVKNTELFTTPLG